MYVSLLEHVQEGPGPSTWEVAKILLRCFWPNHPKAHLPSSVRPAQEILSKAACMQGGIKLDDTTSQEACDAGLYSQPVMGRGVDSRRGHLPASVRLAQDILLAKEAVRGEDGHRAHDGDPGQAL